jgi:hypothetical protein
MRSYILNRIYFAHYRILNTIAYIVHLNGRNVSQWNINGRLGSGANGHSLTRNFRPLALRAGLLPGHWKSNVRKSPASPWLGLGGQRPFSHKDLPPPRPTRRPPTWSLEIKRSQITGRPLAWARGPTAGLSQGSSAPSPYAPASYLVIESSMFANSTYF